MTKVMILGAHGAMAQLLTKRLLTETADDLILFLRDAKRLAQFANQPRITLVDGDVKDTATLVKAMADADIIYSNLGGRDLADQMTHVLAAMHETGKPRLIYISALGARHEVPGKFGDWNEQAIAAVLPGFRATSQLVDESDISYTEIRPAWLTDYDEVDYEETTVAEGFPGTEVSRLSVVDFAFKVIQDPSQAQNASVGLDKPGTAGARPSWLSEGDSQNDD